MMDFNVKKLASDAATVFTRARQYTEEKLGTSERTELDAHFENLAIKADRTKQWTEKLIHRVEGVVTPNPNNRVEDFLFEKLEKRPRERLSNLELFGLDLIDAGTDFGPGTAYGSALIKVGDYEQKIGQVEREYIRASTQSYLMPLRKYLEGEMKTISRERKLLENKRLDLDACKARLRKVKTLDGQQSAEKELRVAQSEFDRQAEITKLLMEGIGNSHTQHLRCMHDFVQAQALYYAQCHQTMIDLQKELASAAANTTVSASNSGAFQSLYAADLNASSPTANDTQPLPPGARRARVLCDYDAGGKDELSLLANEVITVYDSMYPNPDWTMAERGNQKGKVPIAYLEYLQ